MREVSFTAAFMNTSSEQDTDDMVIRRICAGESADFRILVERYKDRVYALCVRQLGCPDLADELSQEIFLRVYRALPKFRYEAKFTTWLTRISLNVVQSYFASARYRERKKSVSFDPALHDQPSPDRQPENDITAKFRECLSKLGARFREVLVLVALEERSYEEAATIVGVPTGTIRSRLHTARMTIKQCVFDEGRI